MIYGTFFGKEVDILIKAANDGDLRMELIIPQIIDGEASEDESIGVDLEIEPEMARLLARALNSAADLSDIRKQSADLR